MGKIKRFFQKTGVALAALALSIVGAINIGALRSTGAEAASFGSEMLVVAGGMALIGCVMIGGGIAKLVMDNNEKKALAESKNPELQNNGQNVNRGQNTNNYRKQNESIGQKIGQNAEKIGQTIGNEANKLGIEIGKIFDNVTRPNNSANPYSSTYNNSYNPYSSQDRMSAGYGGRYNGKNYTSSNTGDVRNARPAGNNNTGYYTGGRGGRGGRPGTNGQQGANARSYNTNYNQNYNTNYNQNSNQNSNYGENVQYGGGSNNRPSNTNMNNQNVQYGSYQNNKPQNTPNTSGLEESAKSNYFENEPGSSSYRSGPLKKEKI